MEQQKELKLVTQIAIEVLLSMAIDETEQYRLISTHSGLGVFELRSGSRVARLSDTVYPEDGRLKAIAPFSEDWITVSEFDFKNNLIIYSNNNVFKVEGESDTVFIYKHVEQLSN